MENPVKFMFLCFFYSGCRKTRSAKGKNFDHLILFSGLFVHFLVIFLMFLSYLSTFFLLPDSFCGKVIYCSFGDLQKESVNRGFPDVF